MGQEVEDRGQWTGKLDFVLSCLGFAVGKTLLWRSTVQFHWISLNNRVGKCLEISISMLQIWRRRIFASLHIDAFLHWHPMFLSGDRHWPIFRHGTNGYLQKPLPTFQGIDFYKYSWSLYQWHLLQPNYCMDGLLLICLFDFKTAMGQL